MEKLEAMGKLTLEEGDPPSKRQTSSQGRFHEGSQSSTSRNMISNRVPQVLVSVIRDSWPSVSEVMLDYNWSCPQDIAGNPAYNAYDHPNNKGLSQIARDVETPFGSVHRHALRIAPPAYQPLPISPLGHSSGPRYQPNHGFVPYQPVRSDLSFCKIPPWHIDKWCRYSTASAFCNREIGSTQSASTAKGRWTGSPPSKVSQHDLRSRAPRIASPSPGPEKKAANVPYRALPKPLPIPVPSEPYLAMASRPPNKLAAPNMLLLALDLNGTLLYRKRASRSYSPRPSLDRFLAYCLKTHKVLIWSSAKAFNVDAICDKIFTPENRSKLLGIWARESLGLSESQYEGKVQVYKRLTSIWDHKPIQCEHPDFDKGGRWSQRNTILIDDSLIKAKGHPYNLIQCPEFVTSKTGEETGDVLGQIVAYLEEVRWCDNVSSFIKNIYKFEVYKGWAWDWKRNERQKTLNETFNIVNEDKILGLR